MAVFLVTPVLVCACVYYGCELRNEESSPLQASRHLLAQLHSLLDRPSSHVTPQSSPLL